MKKKTNERSLRRQCRCESPSQTFSVKASPFGDVLVADTLPRETIDMYSVEALAKRNELEYVSIPSINDPQDLQNVCSDLEHQNVNP